MIENTDSGITYAQVHAIVDALGLTSKTPGKTDVIDVANAIGQTRPAVSSDNPHELTNRTNRKNRMIEALWDMRLDNLRESDNEDDKALIRSYEYWQHELAIGIADRQIVRQLEPDLLIVLEIIVSGRYQVKLPSNLLDLPESSRLNAIVETIFAMVMQEKKKRGSALLAFQDDSEPMTVGVEAEVCNVDTSGPLLPSRERRQARRLDSLHQLGIPTTAEPNFRNPIREVPLPYSSARDQIRAMYDMYRAGIVESNQLLSLHLNVSHLGSQIDDDIFLIHETLLMGKSFGSTERYAPNGKIVPLMYSEYAVGRNNDFVVSARKPLFPNDPASPVGLPFKVREEDGSTLEFRFGYEVHGDINSLDGSTKKSNLADAVRDSSSLLAMCYALRGYRYMKQGKTDVVTTRLSSAWQEFRSKISAIQYKHIWPAYQFHRGKSEYLNLMNRVYTDDVDLKHVSDEDFLRKHGIEKKRFEFHMKNLETDYGRVESHIIQSTIASGSQVEQLTKQALQRLRLSVRCALTPPPMRVSEMIKSSMTAQ